MNDNTAQDRADDATAADVRADARAAIKEGDVMLCQVGATDRQIERVRIVSTDSKGREYVWVELADKPEDGEFTVDLAALIKNETTFIAVGPYAWGQSKKSIEDAVRIMKTQVPRSYLKKGKNPFPVYRITGEFLGVTGMGSVTYRGKMEQVHEGFLIGR